MAACARAGTRPVAWCCCWGGASEGESKCYELPSLLLNLQSGKGCFYKQSLACGSGRVGFFDISPKATQERRDRAKETANYYADLKGLRAGSLCRVRGNRMTEPPNSPHTSFSDGYNEWFVPYHVIDIEAAQARHAAHPDFVLLWRDDEGVWNLKEL